MTAESKVGQVARAIHAELERRGIILVGEDWIDPIGRAAIEAMRKPTSRMVDRAVSYSFAAGFDRPVWTPTAHWEIQYRRAIDAALLEDI